MANFRVQQKYDIEANWQKAVNFIPLEGEIIVYTDLNNFKIGDGKKVVEELPFITEELDYKIFNLEQKINDFETGITLQATYDENKNVTLQSSLYVPLSVEYINGNVKIYL